MTKQDRLRQEKLAARLRQEQIAKKQKHVIHAGNQPSQWGRVVQNENRLIDNGHYMKTSGQLESDRLDREIRRAKKLRAGDSVKWKHITNRPGMTKGVVEKSRKRED